MKIYEYCLVPMVLFVLAMSGCKTEENPVSTDKLPPYLFGQVNDSQGNPVEGCGVHYIYSMSTSELAKLGKTCPSTTISYIVPKRTKVTVRLFRCYTRDTIATLVDDTLNAGVYNVILDMSKITNGIYFYQLKVDTTLHEHYMSFMITDLSALANTEPLVKTNSFGTFSLPFGILGFRIPIISTSPSGTTTDTLYISHAIQIVLCKTGYTTVTKNITIDELSGMSQTFTLIKE